MSLCCSKPCYEQLLYSKTILSTQRLKTAQLCAAWSSPHYLDIQSLSSIPHDLCHADQMHSAFQLMPTFGVHKLLECKSPCFGKKRMLGVNLLLKNHNT